MSGSGGAPAQKAPTPLGVPRPVGPSQPVLAWHHCVVGQEPLLPEVTSKREPECVYGMAFAYPAVFPLRAYTAAMIGEERLVPPYCAQLLLVRVVGA